MKTIVAPAIAAFLATAALSGAAQAQRAGPGYGWACAPAPYGAQGGWGASAFGYYRGQATGPYAEYGAASHMGPNPGGGFSHMGTKHGHVD